MATQPAGSHTYDDFLAMPEDMVIRSIIDGQLFVTPSPTMGHQRVVVEIIVALHAHAAQEGGIVLTAPADVYFSHTNVVEPDVLYVKRENADRVEHAFVRSAPDLVVEVSSPSTRRVDLERKLEAYERFGVPEYWFVDLRESRFLIHRHDGERYGEPLHFERGSVVTTPVLPGLELPVDSILRVAD